MQNREQGKEFIKWWRRENDFVDFELIERFLGTKKLVEFEGYELLNKDEMWEELQLWQPQGLRHGKSTKGEHIEWQYTDKRGQPHTYSCPYTAHNIMVIFDKITQGDTIE